MKGGQLRLELFQEGLEQEVLVRELEEQLWDFRVLDVPGLHSSHLS